MTLLFLVLGNVGRRIAEYADAQLEARETPRETLIEQLIRVWNLPTRKVKA